MREQTPSRLPKHNPFILVALGALGATAMLANAQQSVEYILDTGVGAFNIGPSTFDANVTWLNVFDTQPGGELITRVSVSFGDIADNSGNLGPDAVTLAILKDPNNDHDPTDAILLSSTDATWVDTGFGEFVTYDIEPTRVEGVFFVAVAMDVIERANPASADPNSPSGGTRSWYFYNPKQNLTNLGGSPYILQLSQGPFPSAWMVRATGEAAIECPADFTGDGALDFFDVSAFLGAFNAGQNSADLNDDGVLDFFDVSMFLSFYTQGCP